MRNFWLKKNKPNSSEERNTNWKPNWRRSIRSIGRSRKSISSLLNKFKTNKNNSLSSTTELLVSKLNFKHWPKINRSNLRNWTMIGRGSTWTWLRKMSIRCLWYPKKSSSSVPNSRRRSTNCSCHSIRIKTLSWELSISTRTMKKNSKNYKAIDSTQSWPRTMKLKNSLNKIES